MHGDPNDSGAAADGDVVLLSPDASPDPRPTTRDTDTSSSAAVELPLVELLLQASQTIREERARADALEGENGVLRARLDGVCAAYHRAAAQHLSHGVTANDDLFTYVAHAIVHGTSASGVPPRQSSSSSRAASAADSSSVGRAPSRGSVTVATQSYRRGWEAVAATSGATPSPSPSTAREAIPAAAATAVDGNNAAYLAPAAGSPPPPVPGAAHHAPTATNTSATASAVSPAVQAMAARLRRALAPRPAESMMGDIIHSMVHSLQRDVQTALETPAPATAAAAGPPRRLRGFAMVRLRPCVYQLLTGPPAEVRLTARPSTHGGGGRPPARRSASPPTATPYQHDYLLYRTSPSTTAASGLGGKDGAATQGRVRAVVVHLTIDSGALRVARGGGHVDFIEYLERLLHINLTGN